MEELKCKVCGETAEIECNVKEDSFTFTVICPNGCLTTEDRETREQAIEEWKSL